MPINVGELILSTRTPALRVRAWQGAAPAIIQGGYGGWAEVPRPRRVAITDYQGHSPLRMILDILIDDFASGRSVEPEINNLERMAYPPTPGGEPPIVGIEGFVPHADLDWVIEGIEWTAVERNDSGQRCRQGATLTLLEFVSPDVVGRVSPAEQRRDRAGAAVSNQRYVVKRGDTLARIAAKKKVPLKQLMRLNNIRDPKRISVGDTLRLP